MGYEKSAENCIATRFKSGISGNPGGRPKGKRTLSSILKELMNVKVVTEIEGIPVKDQVQYLIAKALIEKAMKGDIRAISEIFDRTEGKAGQLITHEGDGYIINIVPRRSEGASAFESE